MRFLVFSILLLGFVWPTVADAAGVVPNCILFKNLANQILATGAQNQALFAEAMRVDAMCNAAVVADQQADGGGTVQAGNVGNQAQAPLNGSGTTGGANVTAAAGAMKASTAELPAATQGYHVCSTNATNGVATFEQIVKPGAIQLNPQVSYEVVIAAAKESTALQQLGTACTAKSSNVATAVGQVTAGANDLEKAVGGGMDDMGGAMAMAAPGLLSSMSSGGSGGGGAQPSGQNAPAPAPAAAPAPAPAAPSAPKPIPVVNSFADTNPNAVALAPQTAGFQISCKTTPNDPFCVQQCSRPSGSLPAFCSR